MANEVKWIKISTGVFTDEAFQLMEDMPDRDAIELIWFKLLVLAGRVNNGGVLSYKDRIPYTEEMLSAVFSRPLSTVRMALKTFLDLGLIEETNSYFTVPNWEKYQEQNTLGDYKKKHSEAQKRYRERQKCLTLHNIFHESAKSDITSDITRDITSSYSYSLSNSNNITNTSDNTKSSNNKELIIDIVNYLNERAGTRFKASTDGTKKLISGRLSDGYTFEDFCTVIDFKVSQWSENDEMRQYLRPDTLFRPSNFESYLNAAPKKKVVKPVEPESVKKQEISDEEWLAYDGE